MYQIYLNIFFKMQLLVISDANCLQGKCAAAQHGSKRVIFFNTAAEPSKENEHPSVSNLPKDSQFLTAEKEPSRLEESQQNSATTAARLSSPSPARSTGSPEENQRSATTRLSSPSPTRSSGSPDSGYSTVDLEPGSRALSLARLAVRVRDFFLARSQKVMTSILITR